MKFGKIRFGLFSTLLDLAKGGFNIANHSRQIDPLNSAVTKQQISVTADGLFNLNDDPKEKNDLSSQYPNRVKETKEKHSKWKTECESKPRRVAKDYGETEGTTFSSRARAARESD